MGKLRLLDIVFDNAHAVYYAGTFVSGTTRVELAEPMKIRGVRLHLRGLSEVHWSEGTGTHTTDYDSSETYTDQTIIAWGYPAHYHGETPIMPAGLHEFDFKLRIPGNCPSSFESEYGYIRYSLKVTLDKPWKFDHVYKVAFTVASMLDLNADPRMAQPVQKTASKTLGSKAISATVSLPKMGYVAGEYVPIDICMSENSAGKIDEIRLKIIQSIVFHADEITKCTTTTLAETLLSGQLSYHVDGLRLSAVPPVLSTCSNIRINYSVNAEFFMSGISLNYDVLCPIVIGTVPLRSQFSQMLPQAPQQSAHAAASVPPVVQPTAPPMLPDSMSDEYPDLPQPSYQESVSGKTNIRDKDDNEHTLGDAEFAPRYLCWSPSVEGKNFGVA